MNGKVELKSRKENNRNYWEPFKGHRREKREIQRLDIEELKEFLFALGQGREKAYGNILEVRSIMDATSFEVGV